MNNRQDWTPEEREQLTQELLELHFGCHERPEVLEERLKNEPALRQLQAEVLAQAEALKDAVHPEQPELELELELSLHRAMAGQQRGDARAKIAAEASRRLRAGPRAWCAFLRRAAARPGTACPPCPWRSQPSSEISVEP